MESATPKFNYAGSIFGFLMWHFFSLFNSPVFSYDMATNRCKQTKPKSAFSTKANSGDRTFKKSICPDFS
jgi:hypothetical protein